MRALLQGAVDTVSAQAAMPPSLPAPPHGRQVVIAVGKAAAAMAKTAAERSPGPLSGLIVTR
ncbi:MAG: DUF4147 domain-containing protein, partial [Proteobacteria bacterium]|nr:DUF4147 domain-containing protein [Pseudomonadota bacterium]